MEVPRVNLLASLIVKVPSPVDSHSRRLVFTGAASDERDAISDHECRIEADTELADQRSQHVRTTAFPSDVCSSSRVPDFAIVPIFAITSSRLMPIPLSWMVSVLAFGSLSIQISSLSSARDQFRACLALRIEAGRERPKHLK